MVCGGLAGMVAKTVTNPLERIKMLSQTGEVSGSSGGGAANRGIVAIYRKILTNEGVIGLWAGNGANLLRIFPSKAVVFSSHDFYKSLFRRYLVKGNENNNSNNKQLPSLYSFLAGGLAGVTATAATYPLDLARGRISGKLAQQQQTTTAPATSNTATTLTTTTKKAYTGIWQTVATTVQDEGVRGLYKGVTPTLLGAMPYVGIQFGTVGLLERLFPLSPRDGGDDDENEVNKNDSTTTSTTAFQKSQHHSTPLRKMIFGGLGGMTAGLLTYPNDTVRRLLQLQGSRGTATQYAGYWDCVRQTYRRDGVSRFYRGLTVNLIRMAPNTAVQFGTYELLKQWTGTQ